MSLVCRLLVLLCMLVAFAGKTTTAAAEASSEGRTVPSRRDPVAGADNTRNLQTNNGAEYAATITNPPVGMDYGNNISIFPELPNAIFEEEPKAFTFFGWVGLQTCPTTLRELIQCFELNEAQCNLSCSTADETDDGNTATDERSVDYSNATASDCRLLEERHCSAFGQISQCCQICKEQIGLFEDCFWQSEALYKMCPDFSCDSTSDSSNIPLMTTTVLLMTANALLASSFLNIF